jgi:simple sugar transport system ATP-binding protein
LQRDDRAVRQGAERLIAEFDIRTPSPETSASSLSGGNQQKMVVAREFSRSPRLLIASQPTRGIDVGSIEFIHQRIVQQRDAGAAVLLVSAELDEIMALSDRIAVMYKGQIIETLPAKEATREQLGLLMAGIRREREAPWRALKAVGAEQPESQRTGV